MTPHTQIFKTCKINAVCKQATIGVAANNGGVTPLHIAAEKGHFDICKLILENMEDKNPAMFGRKTPLAIAALNGHIDICKLIIENLENKKLASDNNFTLLYYAAFAGFFYLPTFASWLFGP